MLNGVMSALLVLTGGACALAGYLLGSWRQRRAIEADLAREEMDSRERFLDLLENLLHENEGLPDDRPN
jgi:hypothetical protein